MQKTTYNEFEIIIKKLIKELNEKLDEQKRLIDCIIFFIKHYHHYHII